ncbi:MAG: Zn-dependent hydrolase [Cyclobacteriaceae bacterium]|nr:Zn-dependent hydrolase [Cyclobacteriaceae bacterium]
MRILVVVFALYSLVTVAQPQPRGNPKRMEQRILKLGTFGANPQGGVSRVAYSDADLAGRAYVMNLMKAAGLDVSVDAAGNIIGKRKGTDPSLPVIAFGSHIDSVPGGGNYDGDVGSLGAIECIELMNEHKITTRHPLEVIIFQNEEGGLIGSEALCGILPSASLDLVTHSGKTIRQGIADIGGNVAQLSTAAKPKGYYHAFLELHIEQGGILDQKEINIGVVEGIVGINQWRVTITGKANHAGTTPMDQRQDAMVAAAKLTVAVNKAATSVAGRQVATVGQMHPEPGAPNVIPGKVTMSIEIRDLSHEKILSVFDAIREQGAAIEKETGTTITYELTNENLPAPTDKRIQEMVSAAAKSLGFSSLVMPSGAGHDAQDMATLAPTGMIFVPSKNGVSHAPDEYTSPEDMANGVSVLLQTVLNIDKTKF